MSSLVRLILTGWLRPIESELHKEMPRVLLSIVLRYFPRSSVRRFPGRNRDIGQATYLVVVGESGSCCVHPPRYFSGILRALNLAKQRPKLNFAEVIMSSIVVKMQFKQLIL